MGNTISYELEDWTVTASWPDGVLHGGPCELAITPTSAGTCPAGGISSTLLREIDTHTMLVRLREQQASTEKWRASRQASTDKMNRLLASYAADRKITDTYLALLSRAYVSCVNQGQEKPLVYLAGLTGKTEPAIRNNLWLAVRRGFLERSPGRVGGKVTGKAAGVLSAELAGLGGSEDPPGGS